MKKFSLLFLVVSLTLGINSCSKENITPELSTFNAKDGGPYSPCGSVLESDLLAGQHMNAGVVKVSNNGDSIRVEVTMLNGWTMKLAHLYVGPASQAPLNKNGSPKNGHFPIQQSFNGGSSGYVFMLPKGNLTGNIMVAFHAEVRSASGQQETAWADGLRFTNKNWATFINYAIQECFDV